MWDFFNLFGCLSKCKEPNLEQIYQNMWLITIYFSQYVQYMESMRCHWLVFEEMGETPSAPQLQPFWPWGHWTLTFVTTKDDTQTWQEHRGWDVNQKATPIVKCLIALSNKKNYPACIKMNEDPVWKFVLCSHFFLFFSFLAYEESYFVSPYCTKSLNVV